MSDGQAEWFEALQRSRQLHKKFQIALKEKYARENVPAEAADNPDAGLPLHPPVERQNKTKSSARS